ERRDNMNVGIMHGGEVGIVEQIDIVRKDYFLAEAFEDPLHRETGAYAVVAIGLAGCHDLAVGPVEGSVVVMLLRRRHRAAGALQGDAHLARNLMEPVREHFEGDGVDVPVQHASVPSLLFQKFATQLPTPIPKKSPLPLPSTALRTCFSRACPEFIEGRGLNCCGKKFPPLKKGEQRGI